MLVGISGQLGSGKDSVAQKLVESYGFTKMALADPMKRFTSQVFSFTDEQLWGPSKFRNILDPRYKTFNDPAWNRAEERFHKISKHFIGYLLERPDRDALGKLEQWFELLRGEHTQLSPRVALQTLGSDWGRGVDKSIWINSLINRAAAWTSHGPVVVSDVRFANELKAIKDDGGKLVKLARPDTDAQAQTTGIKNHPSEKEQLLFNDDQFDFVIINDGTLEELHKNIDRIVPSLK